MFKFITVNFVRWFLEGLKGQVRTYPQIFRKSWIFILFVVVIFIFIKLLQMAFVWTILAILVLEFFHWLAAGHD